MTHDSPPGNFMVGNVYLPVGMLHAKDLRGPEDLTIINLFSSNVHITFIYQRSSVLEFQAQTKCTMVCYVKSK